MCTRRLGLTPARVAERLSGQRTAVDMAVGKRNTWGYRWRHMETYGNHVHFFSRISRLGLPKKKRLDVPATEELRVSTTSDDRAELLERLLSVAPRSGFQWQPTWENGGKAPSKKFWLKIGG